MAFLNNEADATQEAQRFSLLLLRPQETYYEDFSVNMYPNNVPDRIAMDRAIKGRLKVCSHSLLFDPQEATHPILKFELSACLSVARWEAPLTSPMTGDIFSVRTREYVQMMEDNLVRPYRFVKPKSAAGGGSGGSGGGGGDKSTTIDFRFSPNYVGTSEVLGKIAPLLTAAKGTRFEREELLQRVTREHQLGIKFNNLWLEDFTERIIVNVTCDRVTPLVRNRGRVVVTTQRIYFQPFNNVDAEPVRKFKLADVRGLVRRRFLLRDRGLELHLTRDRRLYFAFDTPRDRAALCDALVEQPVLRLELKDQGNMMLAWQAGQVSNFEYLMFLNEMADRGFSDLGQYPVFPWILSDYTSDTLDLSDPSVYRDLTKPVGALNPKRLESFRKRYDEMPSEHKFLYGTHYSTPGFVLFYTIRVAPQYALCLQNGKFDHAERLFTSVADAWRNVNNDAADVKELIPEFYMPGGAFLCNKDALDLGATQAGERVGDVVLPPWARDASDFTTKCRQALESDYVSQNIHHWIDLIFGYKQRGPEAVKADNVFYHLTYEGVVDLEAIEDATERASMEAQITEFGQTPKQLFTIPHPQRKTIVGGGGGGGGCDSGVGGVGTDAVIGSSSSSIDSASTVSKDIQQGRPSTTTTASPAVATATASAAATSASASAMKLPTGNVVVAAVADVPTTGASSLGDSVNTDAREDTTTTAAAPVVAGVTAPARAAALGWSALAELEHESTMKVHRQGLRYLTVDGDGKMLYSVSQDGTLKVYSLEDQYQMHSVVIGGGQALSSLCLLPDETVVLSSWDDSIYFYSVEYGRTLDTWQAHDDAVSRVVLLGTDRLLTSSWDTTLKLWDLSQGVQPGRDCEELLLGELAGHDTEVRCLDTHGTDRVVSGDADGVVILWDTASMCELSRFYEGTEAISDICFTPDGRRIVTAAADGIHVYDIELQSRVLHVQIDAAGHEVRCIRTDGTILLAGTSKGALCVYDLVSGGALITTLGAGRHTEAVTGLWVSADAKTVVSGAEDRTVCVWRHPLSGTVAH